MYESNILKFAYVHVTLWPGIDLHLHSIIVCRERNNINQGGIIE
jgi:hypothetical protein